MIKWFEYSDEWKNVKRAARTTINREGSGMYPDYAWKKTILLCEHSPIRKIRFAWKWENLKSWVSVHFVRHNHGIEHFVTTQRSDRTGINRDDLPQSALVSHECECNAQEAIYISRKRLCMQASPETRAAWKEVVEEIRNVDPVLADVCVPECVYRGFCPEFNTCGYADTPQYYAQLEAYRRKQMIT